MINRLEICGKNCKSRKNRIENMAQLRDVASENPLEILEFLREQLSLTITETENGIIMYLGKDKCTCLMASMLSNNADVLCNCTCRQNKAVWSEFFGSRLMWRL